VNDPNQMEISLVKKENLQNMLISPLYELGTIC
jgi:hypothetical protein